MWPQRTAQTKATGSAGGKITVANVYYYNGTASAGAEIPVLTGNVVTVKTSVTKDMMKNLTEATSPTLTFKAYAVQKANIDSVTDAWSVAKSGELPTPTA